MIVSYEMCEVSRRDRQSLLAVLSVCHVSGTVLCVTSSSCVILTQLCDGDDVICKRWEIIAGTHERAAMARAGVGK